MACKLRCIHTLYGCNAIAEITGVGYKHGILKNITATGQPAKEEIGTGIFGAFVITKAAWYLYSLKTLVGSIQAARMSFMCTYSISRSTLSSIRTFILSPTFSCAPSAKATSTGPLSEFFSMNNFFTSFSGVSAEVILSRSSKYCQ